MEEKNQTDNSSKLEARSSKLLKGIVVKTAMKDTATVLVERYVMHPKYKKYLRRGKKYLVHDPGNTAQIGDKVVIREIRPISKRKHFTLVNPDASVGTPTARRG